MSIVIGNKDLTCNDVLKVARFKEKVELAEEAEKRILKSRELVEEYVKEGKIAYGVTTGVGKLCNTYVSPKQAEELQVNLSRSHACGVGEPLLEEEARAIMLIRLNTFSLGYSGVTIELVEMLINMLNNGVTPFLPRKAGNGSGGSLSICANLALCVRGEGRAFYQGQEMESKKALEMAGLKPIVLKAKECLCLINGTHTACGIAALAYCDLLNAVKAAEITAAINLEAISGNTAAFDERINNAKRHKGQRDAAKNINLMLTDSAIYNMKHKSVQDAYSFRCLPQIHGGVREMLDGVKYELENEINSASDNPQTLVDDKLIFSCGNFNGQLLSMFTDNLALACSVLAKITERRIARMVDPQCTGLPDFLIENSGVNSGYMIPQYVAANMEAEIKLLANPVSSDSTPVSGGQEDVNSNVTISANKARDAVDDMNTMLGVELIVAAQALELSKREDLGKGTIAAVKKIRSIVPSLESDRWLEPEIVACAKLVQSGEYVAAVEEAVGKLY